MTILILHFKFKSGPRVHSLWIAMLDFLELFGTQVQTVRVVSTGLPIEKPYLCEGVKNTGKKMKHGKILGLFGAFSDFTQAANAFIGTSETPAENQSL